MKNKAKKIVLASCCLAFLSSLAFGAVFDKDRAVAESVGQLIDGKGFSTQYDYANEAGKKGFLLSAENDTEPMSIQRNFVGVFDMNFEMLYGDNNTYGAGHLAFAFTAEDGTNFTLHIKRDGSLSSAYVEANGEKMGINRSNTGFSALLNKSGIYTNIVSAANYTVQFNPAEMTVSVNGILVWDLSEETIDGRNVGFTYAPFQKYTVEISTSEISGVSKMLIYTINGEELSGSVLKDTGAPVFFVEKVADAVVGKPYKIPTPFAYDLKDDACVSEISTEIFAPNGSKVNIGENADTFVPQQEGEFLILYKAKDAKGNVGVYDLKVTAKAEYNTEILVNGYLLSEAPKNSEVVLPAAVVASDIFDYQYASRYASVRVLFNGTEIEALSGLAQEAKTLKITETGDYTIVYSYTENGLEEEIEHHITGLENGYTDFAVGDYYATGEVLKMPSVVYFNGTKNTEAVPVLTLPSGKTVSEKDVVLSEAGEYTLYYTTTETTVKSREKRFMVNYEASDLFEVNYGSIKTGASEINNDLFGVQASLSAAGSLTYKNVIDFTGNTQDDVFLELMATPSRYYNVDFTQFLIRLTDTEDPSNWVEIKAFDMASNRADGTYVRARRNGTPYVAAQDGYTTSKPGNPGYGGYPVLHSFRGNVNENDYKGQTLRFGYDPTTKTMYCHSNGMDSNRYGRVLADLCDPTWCGEWDGFTKNTAYLTITCAGISTSANFAILTVDGKDLTNDNRQVIPTKNPVLNITKWQNETMPNGVSGKAYRIPECTAKDAFNEALPVRVSVYRDYNLATQTEVSHTEYFTPNCAGEYTIVYAATDYLGRTSVVEKKVTVYAENAYANELKWNYELSSVSLFTELLVGKYIGIAECVWNGGAGDTQAFIEVYDPNGDIVETFRQKNVLIFFAEAAGVYTVEYTAIDYLQESVVYTKEYNIKSSLKPALKEEIILPDYMINGINVTLPVPTAYDYNAGESVTPKIVVEDGSGERTLVSNVYTPSVAQHGETISITYVYGEGDNALSVKNSVIGLKVDGAEGGLDMSKYFVATAGELTSTTECIAYTTNEKDSVLTFAKSIPVNGFKFVYNVGAGSGEEWGNVAFNGVEITLSDSADPYYKVVLEYKADGDAVLFSINGGASVRTVGSFTKESLIDMQFSYASTTHDIFNIRGTKIGTVKNYVTGEEFRGFASGEVYMSIRLLGVTGVSSIKLYSINEQPFSSISFDRIKPVIVSKSESEGGVLSVGDTAEVSSAYATDILSNVDGVLVNVKAPSGTYVTATDGTVLKNVSADRAYQFVCAEVGTYDIRYSVKDSSRNSGQLKRLINVVDKVPPTVTFEKNPPAEVKVNTEVVFPQALVEDASEYTVSIMIYDAYSATYKSVQDNKYKFTEKGTFIVRYFVFDSFYNCVITDFEIVVY